METECLSARFQDFFWSYLFSIPTIALLNNIIELQKDTYVFIQCIHISKFMFYLLTNIILINSFTTLTKLKHRRQNKQYKILCKLQKKTFRIATYYLRTDTNENRWVTTHNVDDPRDCKVKIDTNTDIFLSRLKNT